MYMSLLFICSGRSLLFFLEYLYFHMLGWISGFGHIASSVLATHVWILRVSTTSLAQALQSSTSLLGADVCGTQAVTIPPPDMIFFYPF